MVEEKSHSMKLFIPHRSNAKTYGFEKRLLSSLLRSLLLPIPLAVPLVTHNMDSDLWNLWGPVKRFKSRGASAIDLHAEMKARSISFDSSSIKKDIEPPPSQIQKSVSLDNSELYKPEKPQRPKKPPKFKLSPSCQFYAENTLMRRLQTEEFVQCVVDYQNGEGENNEAKMSESLSELKIEIEKIPDDEEQQPPPKTIPKTTKWGDMEDTDEKHSLILRAKYKCFICGVIMHDPFEIICDDCAAKDLVSLNK